MKDKIKAMLAVALVLIAALTATVLCTHSAKEEPEPKEVKQAEPLVITTTPKNKVGTLTIYDEHGGVFYQYKGEIDVKNSGQNGEKVEIVVLLPSTGCSCFDDEADNTLEALPDKAE